MAQIPKRAHRILAGAPRHLSKASEHDATAESQAAPKTRARVGPTQCCPAAAARYALWGREQGVAVRSRRRDDERMFNTDRAQGQHHVGHLTKAREAQDRLKARALPMQASWTPPQYPASMDVHAAIPKEDDSNGKGCKGKDNQQGSDRRGM
eukprot:scaffold60340_cov32-Tisochrysis_lutea.AAC.2